MADDKIVSGDDLEEETEEETTEEGKKDTTPSESEEEEEKGGEADKEPEVPVREATLQQIIARKNQQIKKLKSKTEEEGEEGEDDELTPEAREMIHREVEAGLKPLREGAISQETEKLLSNLYGNEPEAKAYDKVIRKFISFEKNGVKPYEHIPPSVIYHHLAFGEAETAGAEKGKAAELEANLAKNKGRGVKPKGKKTASGLPSIEEMQEMSDEEFAKEIIGPALQV